MLRVFMLVVLLTGSATQNTLGTDSICNMESNMRFHQMEGSENNTQGYNGLINLNRHSLGSKVAAEERRLQELCEEELKMRKIQNTGSEES